MSGKLGSIAKIHGKQEEEKKEKEDDSKYSWLDDYISSKDTKEASDKDAWWKKKSKPGVHRGAGYSSSSWLDDTDSESSSGSFGRYNGYSYGSRAYSSGYSYYGGGSNSIFSSRSSTYSTGYTSGGTSILDLREHLDIKNFVSNLLTIHDTSVKRTIVFQTEHITSLGNILAEESKMVPIMAEVLLMSNNEKTFNERLDILSGQCLMTAVMNSSKLKNNIVEGLEKKIVSYAKKQAGAAPQIRILLRALASMLAEALVEEDIVTDSPGYKNYINSFRDYYYSERLVTGAAKHRKLNALDITYAKIRHPEKINEILEAAERYIKPDNEKAYNDIVNTNKILDRAISLADLTADNIFEKAARIMMIVLSAQSSKLSEGDNIESANSSEFERAIGRVAMEESLLHMMNHRDIRKEESETMSALHRLERYDYSSYEVEDPVEGGLLHFKKYDMSFYTMQGDKTQYEIIRDGISTYIAPLKRMMKFRDLCKKTTLTSQRRGVLDKRKLSTVNSTDRIYKKTYVDIASSVSICLVVDESGSMWGAGIDAARALACLFSEAFLDSKTVELKVYGHTAQEDDSHYGEPAVTIRKYPTKISLSEIKARANNIDGIAMHAIAKDFLKVAKPDNKKIMIVLSDGNPAGHGYGGSAAVKHTKKCVDLVEAMGIIPMQVAIASHVNSADMFKRFFKFTNMSTFLPDMERMIRDVLRNA